MKKVFISILILVLLFLILERDNPRLQRISKRFLYHSQAVLSLTLERDWNVKLVVPFHRQEHALSCEIATLKMVLNYYGVAMEENELLKKLPFDTKKSRGPDNVWGNPGLGFVGDIDGKIPNLGYGVYEKPILNLALESRPAKILEKAALADVLKEVSHQHPVIVWGSLTSGKDISWKTRSGDKIKAVSGEHTRVVIGFSGPISSPKNIVLLDPIYGQITMAKNKFLADWALLDNKAVVVY